MADGAGASETAIVLRSLTDMSTSLTEMARQVGIVSEKAGSAPTHKEMMTQMNELRREIMSTINKGMGDLATSLTAAMQAQQAAIERSQDEVARKAVANANSERQTTLKSLQDEQEREEKVAREVMVKAAASAAAKSAALWVGSAVIFVGGVIYAISKAMHIV